MRRRSIGVVGVALALVACGADAPEPVVLAEFSARAQDAICAWATRCRHVPDDATCRRLLDPKAYDTRRAADAVAAGRLAYDAEAAGRCVAVTADAVCQATPFSDPSCDDMLRGVVGQGEPCSSSFECADFADCEVTACGAQCCVGTCGPPGFDPGEPPPRAPVGASCDTHPDCVEGAYCELDKRCTALPDAAGEPCLFGCAWGDLYCDVDTLTCKAYGARGAACDPDGIDAPPCDPTWSYCDGVCRDRPGVGDACDAGGRSCIASTWCDAMSGTCAARGEAGTTCQDSDQCDVVCDDDTARCADYESCTIGP